jgi:hypothetical protein
MALEDDVRKAALLNSREGGRQGHPIEYRSDESGYRGQVKIAGPASRKGPHHQDGLPRPEGPRVSKERERAAERLRQATLGEPVDEIG